MMDLNKDWYQTAIEKYEINEISYNELSVGQTRIGRGGFGIIYKTTYQSEIVAIKEITIDPEDDEKCIKNFIKELKIHSRVEHERITRFYGISRNGELYYLVLEYANQGNLREFLIKKKNCNFEWKERVQLAVQIAEGLLHLHDKLNFAHRDLHTKNILINDGNIKIADFGLSKNLNSIMSSKNKLYGMVPFIDPQKLNNVKTIMDKRSDIYSLGVVLWEISSCCMPFPEEDMYLTIKIIQGLREKPVKGTPMEYKEIYTNCWHSDPDSRPLISQVLSKLQSLSLEPVFEDSENIEEINSPPYCKMSNESTSEYFNNLSSLIIPDGLTLPFSINCKSCGLKFTDWCHKCEAKKFQENFPNWTSGNNDLDKLIRNSQLNATKHNKYFEWINYDRFKNKGCIVQGSYCKIYIATWLNGIRELWSEESQQWERTGPVQIILRKFRFESTIKNLELHLKIENIINCYGFTQDPETKAYYMVLKYANGGNLLQHIRKNFPCSWFERISILQKIARSLYNIHKANYIHRDLYPGNILIQEDGWKQRKLNIYISELDSCANLNSEIDQQRFGNLLYVAPEVLAGKGNMTSIKSDIYSLGIIMWELASGDEPYSDYETDDEDELILDIINGARPNDVIGTPKCYHDLMQRCLDADPEKRPTTLDFLEELKKSNEHQFEAADRKIRDQPLGTRPNQLSKDNVERFVEQISAAEGYSGKASIRFTNKSLQFDFDNLPEPKKSTERCLCFNEGLLAKKK
ncbi:kinase-like domain-containing protein [Glomus cerebriforme]|uniref:Kinase-like domain-containing protein n=1 Tax=Glomus cerebriforme TaxID=658196 RepID=A0A397SYY7_9GLOM|nr:kinase-like domain-containing protein [Glomus cerebriforme]